MPNVCAGLYHWPPRFPANRPPDQPTPATEQSGRLKAGLFSLASGRGPPSCRRRRGLAGSRRFFREPTKDHCHHLSMPLTFDPAAARPSAYPIRGIRSRMPPKWVGCLSRTELCRPQRRQTVLCLYLMECVRPRAQQAFQQLNRYYFLTHLCFPASLRQEMAALRPSPTGFLPADVSGMPGLNSMRSCGPAPCKIPARPRIRDTRPVETLHSPFLPARTPSLDLSRSPDQVPAAL